MDCETGYKKGITANSLMNRSLNFQGNKNLAFEKKQMSKGHCQIS